LADGKLTTGAECFDCLAGFGPDAKSASAPSGGFRCAAGEIPMKLLIIAALLPFVLSGCFKKPGEGHFDECAKQIRFRGPQKPEIGFGETAEATKLAGQFSEWFKYAWDRTANDFLKFDRQEPKTFCRIKDDVVVFISYVPDAFLIRKDDVENMCIASWSAVQGVQRLKLLPHCNKVYVVLRGPGMYGPLVSGRPEDKDPVIDRDRHALNAVYPYFDKKK
jgi:hypothetical protein